MHLSTDGCHGLFFYRVISLPDPDVVKLDDFLTRGSCHNRKEQFLDRMQRVLGAYPNDGVPHQPSQVTRGVFLGTTADADNHKLLKKLGISHIINCASPWRTVKVYGIEKPSAVRDGILGYMGLDIEDTDRYNISPHFRVVCDYIKRLRMIGGNVIIVGSGVSAASTLAIAYMMLVKRQFLLDATSTVKNIRTVALTNVNFMRQLVDVAAEEELLDHDIDRVKAPRFARQIDKPRLYSAHLPDISLIATRPYTLFKPNLKPREEYQDSGPFYRRSYRRPIF